MSRRARSITRSSYSGSDSGYGGSPRPSSRTSSARKRSGRPSSGRARRSGGVSKSSSFSRKFTAGGSEWNKKDTTTQPASHGIPTAFADAPTNQSVGVAAFLDSVSGEPGDRNIIWFTYRRATDDSDMELKEAWAKYTDDHGQVYVQNFSGEDDPDEEE